MDGLSCCVLCCESRRSSFSIILFTVDKCNVNLALAKCTYLHRTIFFKNYPALYWRWQSIKGMRVKLTPASWLTTADSKTVLWPVNMDGISGRTFFWCRSPPPSHLKRGVDKGWRRCHWGGLHLNLWRKRSSLLAETLRYQHMTNRRWPGVYSPSASQRRWEPWWHICGLLWR